jgi:hypothetical protein
MSTLKISSLAKLFFRNKLNTVFAKQQFLHVLTTGPKANVNRKLNLSKVVISVPFVMKVFSGNTNVSEQFHQDLSTTLFG